MSSTHQPLAGIYHSHGMRSAPLTQALGFCRTTELLQNHFQIGFLRQFAAGMF